MQIEQGKFYKTRDGRKVGPAKPIENGGEYPWNVPHGGKFYGYANDGVSCIDCDDDDLIAEWTDEPTGTLKWLSDNHGLKAGDAVEYTAIGEPAFEPLFFVFRGWVNGVPYSMDQVAGGLTSLREDDRAVFRIVSSADDKPKIWDDMTNAEKGALLLAKYEGKPLQMLIGGDWFDHDGIFAVNVAYRIKPEPEPVVETMVLYGDARGNFATIKFNSDTHKLTYTITNGVIDCDSVKMEVL